MASSSLFSGNQSVLAIERRKDRIAREVYEAIQEARRLSNQCDEIQRLIIGVIAKRASLKIQENGK